MAPSSRTFFITSSAVILVVILIGLTHIPCPFTSDQAFFTIGAQVLHRGGVLYRDYCDVKQPGIFCYYWLAGSLFGFTEVGIYTCECLYEIAFSIVLIFALARYFSSSIVAACLPLFTVAFYYGVAGPWHRAQIESVVGFPFFLMLWFALRAEESRSLSPISLFFSGLFGGIVLFLKLFFLPILMLIWFLTLFHGIHRAYPYKPMLIGRSILCLFCGVALPLLLCLWYFAYHGALNIFLWTTFVWPPRIVTENNHSSLSTLVEGHRWFFGNCASSLALAVVGLSPIATRRLDPLSRNLLLWTICGFVAIQLQVRSWWQFHYVLLFVPLGILAARGVDALWAHVVSQWGRLGQARLSLMLALTLSFLYISPIHTLAYHTIKMTSYLRRYGIPCTRAHLREIERSLSYEYGTIEEEVKFLSDPSSAPGSIYVCGYALYLFLSERREPIPFPGLILAVYVREQRESLLEQLRQSPPEFIFVAPFWQRVIDNRFQSFQLFLNDRYKVYRRSGSGVWYALCHRNETAVR